MCKKPMTTTEDLGILLYIIFCNSNDLICNIWVTTSPTWPLIHHNSDPMPFPFHLNIVVVTLDFLPPCFLVHWQKIIIHEIFHMFIAFRGIKDILRFISQTESAAVDWPIDYMVPVNNGKMADLIALLPEQWSMSYERRRRTDR